MSKPTALHREGCYELTEGKLDNARKKLKKLRDDWWPEPVVEPLGRDPDGWANYIVWAIDRELIKDWLAEGVMPEVERYAEWLHQYMCGFISVGGKRYAYCLCQGCQQGGHGCYHVAEAYGKHLTWAMSERVGVILRPVSRMPKPAQVAALIERVLPEVVDAPDRHTPDDDELSQMARSVAVTPPPVYPRKKIA